ncbi:uncharacterized protein LOC143150266 [Ptiloglossa arizonensis]|uniref:uncharacterized protein LOC143150266 n=1 Tax=Ptiloglossa arizonensis TaxID=3350558 RepID=UPI003FA16A4C
MSQPNHSVRPRKKVSKCSSTSPSGQNSNHKLKRISSTSTYIMEDEKVLERGTNATLDDTNVDPRDDVDLYGKKIDKTTSSTTFSRGRKFWSPCNSHRSNIFVSDNSVIEEESELINALTKQLYLVESQMQKVHSDLKRNEDQLKSRDQEIGRLKRKVKDWEAKTKNQETLRKKEQQQRRIQTNHSEYLYKRCLVLEHKIYEMEKFLADYGLIWVGDTNNPKSPEAATNNYIGTCYEQIIENIDQLNLAAGKGEVYVQHNEKGNSATFKTTSCMPLKFYKNGMIVQDGILRPYDDPVTISFLRDILDGYFPSELQQAHPNGVPFKVEDHRHQMYLGNTVDFPGHGYRLGKQPRADNTLLSREARRPSTAPQKSGRRPSFSKDNLSNNDFTTPLASSTARSVKSRSPRTDTPPIEMYVLRSQILASHNNICSDTHLQSHINAELGLSNRKEKRELATKPGFDICMKEGSLTSRGVLRFPSSGRRYYSSTDRSTRPFISHLENVQDRARHRTRSSSLPNSRVSIKSKSTTRTSRAMDFGKNDPTRLSNPKSMTSATKRNLRAAKCVTSVKKSAPPILHQINEPTGELGELRLKVRSLNGGTVYLVHVSADEPIARLYQLLDTAMSRIVPRGYKIVLSGYSPRRLEQLGTTLRQLGITRDSVLHLVND